MAGLCRVVGPQEGAITELASATTTFGDQQDSLFRNDRVEIGYVDHEVTFDEQPATTENVSIWCWGDILGHEYQGEYTPRSGELTDAEYCTSPYEDYGLNFITGLNSEFSEVIYDHESETISLFTIRLGSRPIYYTRTSDGSLAFSSLLQSLAAHPEVDLEANPEFLAELLAFSHASGVETTAKEIEKVPPASVLTLGTEGNLVDNWRYWWPVPTERKDSYPKFVDQFICPLPCLSDTLHPEEILLQRIKEKKNSIQNSGINFPSWNSMVEFVVIYPITNVKKFIFYETLNHMLPPKYPFLYNRILDLALQMFASYRYQRDIVKSAMSELALIPHPGHGLPLHYPYHTKHYLRRASALQNKIGRTLSSRETDDSIGGRGGSWSVHATLIHQHSFVGDIPEKNEERIRAFLYLDYDAAQDCYTAHLNGGSYTQQLYALITVLESSLDLTCE